MTYMFIAVNRAVRTVYFPILLILLMLALVFVPFLGDNESIPTAAVCDLDSTDASARILRYLTDDGFEVCTDTVQLYNGIKSGKYDCGAIIPEGFEQLLSAGNINGAVTFVIAPTSFAPDIHKNRLAAAIYTELAPLTAHALLPESDITADEAIKKYRQLLDEGAAFTFEVIRSTDAHTAVSTDGSDSRARTYTLAAASFIIFALMMYSACETADKNLKPLSARIGIRRTILFLTVPDIAVRILGVIGALLTAGAVSYAASGADTIFSLCPALAVYTLLTAAWAILAVTVLSNVGRVHIYTFFTLIAALAVCPIYTDIALFLPWIRGLRWLITPYLLWLCADLTPICALIAVAALPSALLAMCFKNRAR